VSDPLAGMIWHIVGLPDLLSHARNSQPGSRCSPPDPGFCLSEWLEIDEIVHCRAGFWAL